MRRSPIPGRLAAAVSVVFLLSACGGGSSTPPVTQPGALNAVTRGLLGHAPPHPPSPTGPVTAADRTAAAAGGWQKVAAPGPFGSNGAGTPLLMTDGTVMIGDNTSHWYALTPDANGSYVNGSWKKRATLPGNYGPLYFASAVLPDGKLIINGGEYNFFQPAETTKGAMYDPAKDTWQNVSPPQGWTQIGDAQSAVLSDGTYMIGNCCLSVQALFDEATMTWKQTGAGKADPNSEEGWTLLPNGKLLTADVINAPGSELYGASGTWSSGGSLPSNITQATEIGPQTLRPNGTVFVAGAYKNSAIYNTRTRAWSSGPALPILNGVQLDSADGPAAVLPSGEVLIPFSPGVYNAPASFYVFNGTSFKHIAGIPNAKNDSSYNLRLLVLPTGQVLATDGSNEVEIYTSNQPPDTSIAPSIASVPTTLVYGTTYTVSGARFNGFTQASTYGDDAQNSTNYPLVEIVNGATHHVFFARTHGHSSMAVASQATVTTMFDVPAGIETGASSLYVVANGIKSPAVAVTIQ